MSHQPADLLSQHAPGTEPDPAELEALWRTIDFGAQPHRRASWPGRTAWLAGSGLAAAAAAALFLAVPTGGLGAPVAEPSAESPSAASPLESSSNATGDSTISLLAATAARQSSLTVGAGEYLHVRSKLVNGGDDTVGGGYVIVSDQYYDKDGALWNSERRGGRRGWEYTSAEFQAGSSPTPAFLASLPTDPSKLIKAVRPAALAALGPGAKDVSARNAISLYLSKALWLGYAPAKVNAALIQALPAVGDYQVSSGTTRSGKSCVKLQHNGPSGVSTACFDPETSQLLETHRDDVYLTVQVREVVDELPSGAAKAKKLG